MSLFYRRAQEFTPKFPTKTKKKDKERKKWELWERSKKETENTARLLLRACVGLSLNAKKTQQYAAWQNAEMQKKHINKAEKKNENTWRDSLIEWEKNGWKSAGHAWNRFWPLLNKVTASEAPSTPTWQNTKSGRSEVPSKDDFGLTEWAMFLSAPDS